MGLRLVLQSRPLCPAFYAISVRRLGTLPAASFRFHLAMDALAVRLTLPTTKRVVDFHHQAIAHAGRTTRKGLTPVRPFIIHLGQSDEPDFAKASLILPKRKHT